MDHLAVAPSFSTKKAHEMQLRLSRKIILEDRLPEKIRFAAGVDVAYAKNKAIGAVAVLDYDSLALLESQIAICETSFPYVPTLLSFREIPPSVSCIKKLHLQPDVFFVDGQGLAHPYRCGFASHLGLVLGKPTIGVAKSRLIGKIVKKGENTFLIQNGEVIASVITTKQGTKPVYVSIGHMISLETATKIVKHCIRNSRLPEPILQAHRIANAEKRKTKII